MRVAAPSVSDEPVKSEGDDDLRAFQRLCRFGPLLGAIWIGLLTGAVDWYLPPPGTQRGYWEADYPYWLSIAFSIVLGSIAGGVLGEAAEHQLAGRIDQAAESCLRWGLAGMVLFLLGPLADFDFAIRHIGYQYSCLVRSFLPMIVVTLFILGRGFVLASSQKTRRG
ncbi:MAG: hypothetical protein P4L33_06060 [Capsulimonadaceae bacterium]|nr:hypothetical protein [Capsulimonadaceae bacterium]